MAAQRLAGGRSVSAASPRSGCRYAGLVARSASTSDQQQVGADRRAARAPSASWRCSARRKASALPSSRYGSRSSRDAAAAAAAEPGDPRLDRRPSGTRLRRSTAIVAQRQPVGLAAGRTAGRPAAAPGRRSRRARTVSSLAAEVRRAGQRAERVGAVGDGVRPALARARSRAGRARASSQVATRSPHSSTLPAGDQRPSGCRGAMHSASTSAEKLRRKTESVSVSPSPTPSPAAMPSPRPASRSS